MRGRNSLLAVLLHVLLPHSLEDLRNVPFLDQIEAQIERSMSQLTIISYRSLPNDAIPYILVPIFGIVPIYALGVSHGPCGSARLSHPREFHRWVSLFVQ